MLAQFKEFVSDIQQKWGCRYEEAVAHALESVLVSMDSNSKGAGETLRKNSIFASELQKYLEPFMKGLK